jgi:hypothetical protein
MGNKYLDCGLVEHCYKGETKVDSSKEPLLTLPYFESLCGMLN